MLESSQTAPLQNALLHAIDFPPSIGISTKEWDFRYKANPSSMRTAEDSSYVPAPTKHQKQGSHDHSKQSQARDLSLPKCSLLSRNTPPGKAYTEKLDPANWERWKIFFSRKSFSREIFSTPRGAYSNLATQTPQETAFHTVILVNPLWNAIAPIVITLPTRKM